MIVLTGGAGFIGSVLLARLNAAGIFNILIVDNLGESEKWRNLAGKRFDDYLQKNTFLKLLESGSFPSRPEVVVHLGACSSTVERNAEYMLENNYRYSKSIAEWCLARNVRFIYASSAATYGDGSSGFGDDEALLPSLRPLNIYGYAKHLFDLWALRTGALQKIVGVKFFNVFGPNEYHKGEMRSVVLKSFEQIMTSGSVGLFRSYRDDIPHGEQRRDFIYVKDCVEVLWWLLNHQEVAGLYNLGSGRARSWNELAAAVFAALDKPRSINFIDMPEEQRERYQYFTEARIEKLRNIGCDLRFHSLEDGVTDYVKGYLSQTNRYL